jgi:undecaprenyl-diphosphatase
MLGVHYPSDVIAGWSFGLLWVLVLMRISTIWLRTPLPS